MGFLIKMAQSHQKMRHFYYRQVIVRIPAAVRSTTCVCARSIAGIADSNPAVGTDICQLGILCLWKVQPSATGLSFVQSGPMCVYVYVWVLQLPPCFSLDQR